MWTHARVNRGRFHTTILAHELCTEEVGEGHSMRHERLLLFSEVATVVAHVVIAPLAGQLAILFRNPFLALITKSVFAAFSTSKVVPFGTGCFEVAVTGVVLVGIGTTLLTALAAVVFSPRIGSTIFVGISDALIAVILCVGGITGIAVPFVGLVILGSLDAGESTS